MLPSCPLSLGYIMMRPAHHNDGWYIISVYKYIIYDGICI